jgi:hypothetical protein
MVTIEKIIVTGQYSTLIKYSSTIENATFYIYLDGRLIATSLQKEISIGVNLDESYVVEILDDINEIPMQVFPGKARLFWFSSEDTDYYKVDEYITDAWVTRAQIRDNGGYMSLESRFLEDGISHQFRIIPVGTNGNEGAAKEFAVLCVRHPDVPAVSYDYDSENQTITIEED